MPRAFHPIGLRFDIGMTSPAKPRSILVSICQLDAHHRLVVSLLVAGAGYFMLAGHVDWGRRLILSWDAFALSLLSLAWARIITAEPKVVLQTARIQHATRSWIFLFVLAAACASLGAVFYLLPLLNGKAPLRAHHYALALTTVLLSWGLIHTVFALQYAYLYYRRHHAGKGAPLIFPDGNVEPDYFDFAYFGFGIGMTSQVSDIQIASRELRRLVLLHGLVAFAFNLAVLGLGFNIISGILGG